MAQFYYPEGQPGPICDAIIEVDQAALDERAQRLEDLAEPATQIITEVRPPIDETNWPLYTICDVDEDGNLVDCQPVFDRPGPYIFTPDLSESEAEFLAVIPFPADFGITDDFFVPGVQAYSCIPWDPDINIRPVTFFSRVGNLITRYPYPLSNPVTYPVNAVIAIKPGSISASFDPTGTTIIVDGEGKGSLTLNLSWDDNPNTLGVALDSLTVAGITLTRSGTSGSQDATIEVEAGQQYPITFSNLNPANSPIEVQGNSLCLKDGAIGGNYPITYTGLNTSTSDIDVAQNGQDLRIDDNPANGFDENAKFEIRETSSNINAEFTDAETLSITGDGGGSVTLRLEWDDDPDDSGTAVDTISVGGQTWTRSGRQGSQEFTISVSPGGGGGDDCNATFSIGTETGGTPTALSLWTEDGDRYGVWTNPAQCTLPCLRQIVTYTIQFYEDGLYFFEIGADDEGEFYFDDETTPFASVTTPTILNPKLFPEATGPLIVSKYVTAGPHTLRAEVTNASPGGLAINDLYVDNSVDWGSISPGAGTAIRQELDGPGSGLSVSATFSADGNNLVVSGNGTGSVTWSYEWDDNPATAGKAVDSITIAGSTITQSGSGGGGSYPITYTGLNAPTSDIDVASNGQSLRIDDDPSNGFDENAKLEIRSTSSNISAEFSSDAETLLISGSGSGEVDIRFEWDDNPDISGTSVDTIEIAGQTFTRSGRAGQQQFTIQVVAADEDREGFDSRTITVNGGQTYPITYTGLNSANGTINVVSSTEICLYDGDGNDCNGTLKVASSTVNTTGLNEVSGFVVPDDSPSGKYLSFGTVTAGPLVANRSATVTLDLSETDVLKIWCIAGTDTNGGERPNDANEVLEVNFGTGWVTLVGSKQFYDISFAQYDGYYGSWTDYNVEVPASARNSNQTIQFRSVGDAPEIGGNYLGLTPAQYAATYANSGDVFGIYKFTSVTKLPPDCDNPSLFALNWATNPGGWYIKICQGAPCVKDETLDWVPVNGRGKASMASWGDFMDKYAIWVEGFATLPQQPQTITFQIFVRRNDTLTLEYSGDNTVEFAWNGSQIAIATGSYGTSATQAIPAVSGAYTLTMTVTNAAGVGNPPDNSWDGNPAGGAFVLRYSDGEIIRTSLDLDQYGNGNMIWNTREAVLYGYRTDCSLRDVESVYGLGFEGYVLYNNGDLDRGEFIDTLKPGYTLQEVTSPSGFTTTYTALHETIIQAYILDITRYPEPTLRNVGRMTGYDGWINHFRTQPVDSLSMLRQQIYNTYITSVAQGGSGEQAYQQSKGGVQGTYDSCDIQRV